MDEKYNQDSKLLNPEEDPIVWGFLKELESTGFVNFDSEMGWSWTDSSHNMVNVPFGGETPEMYAESILRVRRASAEHRNRTS